MAQMFYDDDADLSLIQGKNVAVLGYGSQGHAHALSLRDSGVDVRVGLPEGSKSRAKAEAEGLRVMTPSKAVEESDVIVVLAPDHKQLLNGDLDRPRNDVSPLDGRVPGRTAESKASKALPHREIFFVDGALDICPVVPPRKAGIIS